MERFRRAALLFVAGVAVGVAAKDVNQNQDLYNRQQCIETDPILVETIKNQNYSSYISSGLDGSKIELIVPDGVPVTASIPKKGDVAKLSLNLGFNPDFPLLHQCQDTVLWKITKYKTTGVGTLGWLIVKDGSVSMEGYSGPSLIQTRFQVNSPSDIESSYDIEAR